MSAPVTAEELAEVERITAGPPRHWKPLELSTARTLLPRLASDLADARHDLDTERKALAMLAGRMLDLARELEALRAAVRAHEAATRAGPLSRCWNQADLDLWAAGKP